MGSYGVVDLMFGQSLYPPRHRTVFIGGDLLFCVELQGYLADKKPQPP